MVERNLAKVEVAGSSPVIRSKIHALRVDLPLQIATAICHCQSRQRFTVVNRGSDLQQLCGRGGIGRRVRFRFLWSQGCAGSSPVARTTKKHCVSSAFFVVWVIRSQTSPKFSHFTSGFHYINRKLPVVSERSERRQCRVQVRPFSGFFSTHTGAFFVVQVIRSQTSQKFSRCADGLYSIRRKLLSLTSEVSLRQCRSSSPSHVRSPLDFPLKL